MVGSDVQIDEVQDESADEAEESTLQVGARMRIIEYQSFC